MHNSLKIGLFIGLSCFELACSDSTKPSTAPPGPKTDSPKTLARPAETQTFKGVVRLGDELRTMTDCATGKTYWLDDKTGLLAKKAAEVTAPVHYDGEPSFGVFSGKLMGKSNVGHASMCDNVLSIEKIDSLSAISAENLCLPYNFICHGTEPFWTMTISEGLQGVVLEDISEGKAYIFPWVEPELQPNKSYLCLSTNAQDERIRVLIKPEKTNDGMADTVFDYSVVVAIGKKKWKGVAVKP